jgi:hypothetical protein
MISTSLRPFSFCTTRPNDGWLMIVVYRSICPLRCRMETCGHASRDRAAPVLFGTAPSARWPAAIHASKKTAVHPPGSFPGQGVGCASLTRLAPFLSLTKGGYIVHIVPQVREGSKRESMRNGTWDSISLTESGGAWSGSFPASAGHCWALSFTVSAVWKGSARRRGAAISTFF